MDDVLSKARVDITEGDLGKARDRLHGLILAYPKDLALRVELASIYDALHHPAMAGRYWYLSDYSDDPTAEQAVEHFKKECGGKPAEMLRHLKVRVPLDELPPLAADRLQELSDAAGRKGSVPVYHPDGRWSGKSAEPAEKGGGCWFVTLFIILTIIAVLLLAAFGAVTLFAG